MSDSIEKVAVDLDYGFVKAISSSRKRALFPSLVGKGYERALTDLFDQKNRTLSNMQVIYHGEGYFIGELAKGSRSASRIFERERFSHVYTHIFFNAVIQAVTDTTITSVNDKGSTVKQVEERISDKSVITFYVRTEVSRETSDEDEPEIKTIAKYFVVPVAYDGQSYGVYELPKFTHMEEKTTLKADQANGLQKVASPPKTSAFCNFLDTFFKSYTEDSTDKPAYILEEGRHAAGLNKFMFFVKVASADIYERQRIGEYIVQSEVIMQDPESDMQFHADYQLSIKKDGGQFVVSAMNESEGNKQ